MMNQKHDKTLKVSMLALVNYAASQKKRNERISVRSMQSVIATRALTMRHYLRNINLQEVKQKLVQTVDVAQRADMTMVQFNHLQNSVLKVKLMTGEPLPPSAFTVAKLNIELPALPVADANNSDSTTVGNAFKSIYRNKKV